VAIPLFWSVERDGDTIVVTLPEPLRCARETHPAWMEHCAGAIRDELRQLAIAEGSLLEATLAGDDLPLGETLLYEVGIPQPHVGVGVRLARMPAAGGGVVQQYRHAMPGTADADDATLLAAVRVPITDGHELETARSVWLATRAALAGALSPEAAASPGGVDLRVRFVTGAARTHGSVELMRSLLDGVSASVYGRTEGGDAGEPSAADDRIRVAEVTLALGAAPQLEIELRALPAG